MFIPGLQQADIPLQFGLDRDGQDRGALSVFQSQPDPDVALFRKKFRGIIRGLLPELVIHKDFGQLFGAVPSEIPADTGENAFLAHEPFGMDLDRGERIHFLRDRG